MVIESKRRKFSFNEEVYNLPFSGKKRQQAKRILSYGIKNNRPPVEVLKSLKAKGLGYRKTNFLADYARASGTEFSKTHQAYDRANRFWGAVENLKKKEKLKTYKASVKKMKEFQKQEYAGTISEEDLETLDKIAIDDRAIFGESP